ncbi:uncharacterized protein MELLADRAFT_96430 [Melampsora larici-populina 98AG31]|uniref:Uncharacterized protein n=1 Tax=Melampsora larici-populina (strain 98AG31 / pathotype 3-4-7) TaxID=747676 RepID=F4RET5_MELLP|nr:uncharacterized protein MELLADRAFT_96430 [Melampsora larici-populina 98AG31]EGG09157.1 hypothetical protein MELLADRAFT_96430 [Melampsora larici-populina 98AG31]
MVNRKLSNIPLPSDGRFETTSRAIRTRSYQAMIAQSNGSNLSPLQASTLRLSPIASPVKGFDHQTPSIPFVNRASAPPTQSQLSSASSVNPHINPLIYSSVGTSSFSISDSPTSISAFLGTSTHTSLNKRPATELDVIENDEDG